MNNYIVTAYCFYLPIAIGLIIWTARTIHKNSQAFLADIFHNNSAIATSVNNLLQVGLYLISFGVAFLRLKISPWSYSHFLTPEDIEKAKGFMTTQQQLIEELAVKLGGFVIVLGIMLFLNLILLLLLRKDKNEKSIQANR